MIGKETIYRLVEEKLATSANYVVDVLVKPDNRIIVEIDNDEAIRIDDCAELSRYLEANLDREIEDYELEVSSAGLTSPFKTLRQYKKNIGNEVELQLKSGHKQTGILQAADEKGLTLSVKRQAQPQGSKRKKNVEEEQSYTFDEIKQTRYILRFK
jgi:ribosome maturation factor RimP